MNKVLNAPIALEQEPSVKFLPAFFVDVVELGEEFKSGELPLHMSYFPPLQTAFDARYADAARRLINPMPPFTATVGNSDYFGDQHDIHVKRIESTPQVMVVHRALVAAMGYLSHDTRYRTPYSPHISVDQTDQRIATGDTIEMAGLSIVEKDPRRNTWKVMAKIGLKGENL